jgi:hypothetical protein
MTERELLADCLRLLNELNLAYMVTGSMASNYWGIPRTTHDLDFALQLPPSSVDRVVSAFSVDFHIDEPAVRSAFQPPHQFNAIDTRSALKVDFWLPTGSAFEREMFQRRLKIVLFSTPAWIATAEDVILHKLFWDRLTPSDRQRLDAAGVVAVQKGELDLNYLNAWAVQLGVTETLRKILDGKLKPKTT